MNDLISRQEAIDALGEEPEVSSDDDRYDQYELGLNNQWNDDVAAIKASPSAQPITCKYWDGESNYCALNRPSAQRKGKWIYPTDINGFGRCPHCKALWDYGLISNPFFKFCPKCGNGENSYTERGT